MPPFLRTKAPRIALVIVGVTMALAGFLPLFAGPGYESSIAAGLLLPFVTAVAVAVEVSSAGRAEPLDVVRRGLADAAVFALAAYTTMLLHGLRAGFCDVLGGSAHAALGPGVGALLAGVWGAVAGLVAAGRSTRRARLGAAIGLAVLGPVLSIGVSIGRFYTSPMVFAYDPFVGYFSGTLYDTVVDVSGLVTYRAGSAATLLAALLGASLVSRDDHGRITLRPAVREQPGVALAAAVAVAASLTCSACGDRLGHWQTSATIARELGGSFHGARCDVMFPRGMDPAEVQRFARDCDGHMTLGERWFGAPVPFRITAYLFADARQKGELMGAADTYIAKPWRHEVYLQESGYPHPVLGHEIAHVLAGHFARGPFKVAGGAGGWIPDPGLIEGIAVAASPRDGELSPREWAKAMKDLSLLPRLKSLFAFGFFGVNSSAAYTVSGAFVGYVRERYGDAAVRAWYGGASLTEVTGSPLAELERTWHEDLDQIALPEAARAQAKARFDRPAIFGRRCPHVVDACKLRAEEHKARGDHEGAIEQYRAALELDPGDAATRVAVAKSALRAGRAGEAAGAFSAIAAEEAAPRHVRDRALEELGDMALLGGDFAAAVARYREVISRVVDEDVVRTIEVKIAAAEDGRARAPIVELLIGAGDRGPDKVRAAELLGAWAAEAPEDGMPSYLLGRHYLSAGMLEEAAVRLDRALGRRLALPRVAVEAERLRMVVACGLGDAEMAARFYRAYAARPSVSPARRDAARALLERCGGPGAQAASAVPGPLGG